MMGGAILDSKKGKKKKGGEVTMRLLVEEIISPSTRLLQRSVTQHPSARFPHLRHILVRGTQTGLTWAMRGLPVHTPPP